MADESERILSDAESALSEQIHAERVRFVFIQSTLPIIFSPVSAVILSTTLWHSVDRRRLVIFTIGLVLIAILRVLMTRAFPNPVPAGAALRRWERIYIASIMVVDLWWGFGVLFLLLPGATTESAIVFCFVMLMAGGHTASYSAHPFLVTLGVLALTLPITVAFALQPDAFHWPLAFVSLMFLAASFRSIDTLGYFFGRTYRLAYELQRERDRAEQLARCDALTQLNNRRAFYELGEAALARHLRTGEPLSLLMIDIDHFKSVNDRYGHAGGDVVIKRVAQLIESHASGDDVPGRLGGEEFALLLPGVPVEAAVERGDALRVEAGEARTPFEQHVIAMTLSLGAAQLRPGDTLDALVARADEALYEAKRGGRNRVVAANGDAPD